MFTASRTRAIIGALCLAGYVVPAGAVTIAPTPCDPVYYQSLEARAWLEAQREITQNQNLIFKPDSVLEYTCFDRFSRELADHADEMFSENTRWGTILPTTSMDTALNNLVISAMTSYITANFESRAASSPGPPPPIISQPTSTRYDLLGGRNVGIDHETPFTIGGSGGFTYTCDIMGKIWAEAKCMNFIQEPVSDGFYTFEHYATDPDKRILPTRCENVHDAWNLMASRASGPGVPWTPDPVETYLSYMDPGECTSSTPIETGVQVRRPQPPPGIPDVYDEKICIIPGCHYVPTSEHNGECRTNP